MGLIIRVTEYDFERAFEEAGRGNQFSREGLSALYEYLVEFSDEVGEDLELDVIGLCFGYSEHERPMNSELEDWDGEDDMRDGDEYADDQDTASHCGFDPDDIVARGGNFVIVRD
jgi:hypothetical protein